MKPQPHHTPTTVAEICLRAAEVIRERGWHQKDYANEKGNVCLFAAINIASGSTAWGPTSIGAAAVRRVKRHLKLRVCDSVAKWNDAPDRTLAEVIDALESAALEDRK